MVLVLCQVSFAAQKLALAHAPAFAQKRSLDICRLFFIILILFKD
jgi:hypothetical protein